MENGITAYKGADPLFVTNLTGTAAGTILKMAIYPANGNRNQVQVLSKTRHLTPLA